MTRIAHATRLRIARAPVWRGAGSPFAHDAASFLGRASPSGCAASIRAADRAGWSAANVRRPVA
jgi:hypothetical protein